MSKSRIIVPSLQTLKKWFISIFDTRDAALADDDRPNHKEESKLLYGTLGRQTRDIEHLLPKNAFERFGARVQTFQAFLKGPEFSFGFRSAWQVG